MVNEDKSDSAMLSVYVNEIAKLKAMLEDKAQSDNQSELTRLKELTEQSLQEKSVCIVLSCVVWCTLSLLRRSSV